MYKAVLLLLVVLPVLASWLGLQEQGPPDLSDLSVEEQEMIAHVCDVDRQVHGPAKYYQCLRAQLGALQQSPGEPDLSHLSVEEQEMIAHACNVDRQIHGPAKYYRCLRAQLAALQQSPGEPDLSHLSVEEQTIIARACDLEREVHGPAKYYQCIRGQVAARGAQTRALRKLPRQRKPGTGTIKSSALPPGSAAPVSPREVAATRSEAPDKNGSGIPGAGFAVPGLIGLAFLLYLARLAYVQLTPEKCSVCGAHTSNATQICDSCQAWAQPHETQGWVEGQPHESHRGAEDARRREAEARANQPGRRREHSAGSGESRDGGFDPYKVLGVSRGASEDEIRSAYVKLMAKYHPDKVAHLGNEFQAIAKEKSQAINRAYDALHNR